MLIMKNIYFSIVRFLISILAGFLTGLFILFSFSVLLFCWQVLSALIVTPTPAVNLVQGGLKSVILELPLVVFGLPLLDVWICPGIITGAIAHRLRSFRFLAMAGCIGGLAFSGIVYWTYSIFDPVLTAGFIVLEIPIALAVSQLDRWMTKVPEETETDSTWSEKVVWQWILGILFFTVIVPIIGVRTCCTFYPYEQRIDEGIGNVFRSNPPGLRMNLFSRGDFCGWIVQGFGEWTIAGGVVSTRRGSGYLSTWYDQFSDFILDADIRVNQRGNSGIFFRAHHPPFGLRSQPIGYEAQIDHHDLKNPTGSLYNRVTAGSVPSRDGEWFHMTISAIGANIQIQVNGETVVDATDTTYQNGFIALQAHDPYSVVSFKNVWISIPNTNKSIFCK